MPRDASGHWSKADYLSAALVAGRSPNGVFGLRIMQATLRDLLADLADLLPDAAGDSDLMERAFGRCRYVHLSRADTLARRSRA